MKTAKTFIFYITFRTLFDFSSLFGFRSNQFFLYATREEFQLNEILCVLKSKFAIFEVFNVYKIMIYSKR